MFASRATARKHCARLLPLLKRKEDRSWREKIEKEIVRWWKVLEARAMNDAKPLNPQRVFWELSPQLPDNCILCSDSGSAANWFARDLKIRPGMMASLSGNLATMGPGVPYAIAAKFALSRTRRHRARRRRRDANERHQRPGHDFQILEAME